MKTKLALLLTAALLGAGCNSLGALYERQVVEVVPATVQTNVVEQPETIEVTPAVTNAATGLVTPPVTITRYILVTNFVPVPPIYATNVVARPEIASAIQGTISALPFPGSGIVGIFGAWVYGAYALWKSKRTSRALVEGIEAARLVLQDTPEGRALDHKVKDKLIQHQEIAGVLNEVGKIINKFTGDTVKNPTI